MSIAEDIHKKCPSIKLCCESLTSFQRYYDVAIKEFRFPTLIKPLKNNNENINRLTIDLPFLCLDTNGTWTRENYEDKEKYNFKAVLFLKSIEHVTINLICRDNLKPFLLKFKYKLNVKKLSLQFIGFYQVDFAGLFELFNLDSIIYLELQIGISELELEHSSIYDFLKLLNNLPNLRHLNVITYPDLINKIIGLITPNSLISLGFGPYMEFNLLTISQLLSNQQKSIQNFATGKNWDDECSLEEFERICQPGKVANEDLVKTFNNDITKYPRLNHIIDRDSRHSCFHYKVNRSSPHFYIELM